MMVFVRMRTYLWPCGVCKVVIVDTRYVVMVGPYAVDVLIRAYVMESCPVPIYVLMLGSVIYANVVSMEV